MSWGKEVWWWWCRLEGLRELREGEGKRAGLETVGGGEALGFVKWWKGRNFQVWRDRVEVRKLWR